MTTKNPSWLRRLFNQQTEQARRRTAIRSNLASLEQLENRILLSTLGQIGGAAGRAESSPGVMDAQSNVYLSGLFTGTVDFDPGTGVVERTSDAGGDFYVAKYTPQGALSWVRQLNIDGSGVTVDPAGTPYVFGGFQGTVDFGSRNTLVSAGGYDPLVLKMDAANGNTIWARSDGGTPRDDYSKDVSVGADGSVYTTGFFSQQTDFDPLRNYPDNRDILTATGWSPKGKTNYATDAFVLRLDSAGNFVSVRNVGGTMNDGGEKITVEVDANGNGSLFLMGRFQGTADFDPSTGQANRTSAGSYDIFYARYAVSPTSMTLSWVQSIGGPGADMDYRMDTDSQYLYLGGQFSNVVDFDPTAGTRNITPEGNDAAIAKYRKSDGGLEWVARVAGSSSPGVASRIVVDEAAGMIYVGGSFDLAMNYVDPLGNSSISQWSAGSRDGYVLKLNSAGAYQKAWRMGGTGSDLARVIGVGGGAVYITGYFDATANFPNGQSLTNLGGGVDAYLLALDQPAGAPLLAASAPVVPVKQTLTARQALPLLVEALAHWQASGVDTSALSNIQIQITNLGGTTLGLASGNTIWLDDNAAGWGWSIDKNPRGDSKFSTSGNGKQHRMDLLTVLEHEVGHMLGNQHADAGVMLDTLFAGVRRGAGKRIDTATERHK